MQFICFNDWQQLPANTTSLFEQAAKESIFFSRTWFETLASSGENKQTMVLACVIAEHRLLAMLPLIKGAGNTYHSLKHRYTPLYSVLLAEQDQQQVLACLVEGLSQLPLAGLLLEPVAEEENNLKGLQHAMEMAGYRCDRAFRFYNWFLRVQGRSFEEYMAARPSRLRNTLARKKRKLDREHGYEIRLFTGEEALQKLPDYYAVYNASWKANEQYAGFVDEMVARFSKEGWSRLAILYINQQPAAAQLWFVHHGKASIFRLAYDKVWKSYSPGSIVTSYLMEYVIDTDKVKEVDFLTGNDAYKQDWMSDRRERGILSCVKSVKHTTWYERFIETLKRRLKKIRQNKSKG